MFVSFFVGLFADSSYGDHLPKSRIAPSTPEKTDQMKSDHQSPELSRGTFSGSKSEPSTSPKHAACGWWKEWG